MTLACQSMLLPILDILADDKDRIGFFHRDHATSLAVSMGDVGQQTPIHVRRNGNAAKHRWTLIAGLHRLRAAESIGWTEIAAIQLADASSMPDDLRCLELAENLGQKHRRPIERAIMMVEHARLEEAIDHPGMAGETPQARALRVRQTTSVTMTDVVPWRERTAKAFGLSLSSFERHQRIHAGIVVAMPDLAQQLNDHPLGENFGVMLKLAGVFRPDPEHNKGGLRADDRRLAAEMLLTRDDWKSLDDVLIAAGAKRERVERDTGVKIAVSAWGNLKVAERRQYLDHIVSDFTAGMAKDMVARFKQRGLL